MSLTLASTSSHMPFAVLALSGFCKKDRAVSFNNHKDPPPCNILSNVLARKAAARLISPEICGTIWSVSGMVGWTATCNCDFSSFS